MTVIISCIFADCTRTSFTNYLFSDESGSEDVKADFRSQNETREVTTVDADGNETKTNQTVIMYHPLNGSARRSEKMLDKKSQTLRFLFFSPFSTCNSLILNNIEIGLNFSLTSSNLLQSYS